MSLTSLAKLSAAYMFVVMASALAHTAFQAQPTHMAGNLVQEAGQSANGNTVALQ
ncbi:hypothetical protein [Rhizobium paknamense]|uniref:Uncharacterized protein n=1 Tax=Rhizobium paknamense TaxID=1206817 RepID=A0ABU0I6F9_9HYPH|nr:hypothetical protein [Rhizobium paknamense]MDQ0453805.1 hypothetical protein [Rhizobium paknamense]